MSQTNNSATSCAYTYTVKRGDSFYLIARRLGVPLRDLMNANANIAPTQLMVGDVLCIPNCADFEAQEPTVPDTTPDTMPDTGAGDTGAGNGNGTMNGTGSDMNNGTTNGTGNGSTNGTNNGMGSNGTVTCPEDRRTIVTEGQTVADLQIAYDKSYRTLEAANPTVDLQNLQAGQTICIPEINLACALPSSVVLGEGESLASVAVRFNLPVASILRANPCLAPDDFTQGVTVKLPQ